MKKAPNFLTLFLITTLITYIIVAFARWEFDWVKHLSDLSTLDRLWFTLAVAGKLVIDYILHNYLKAKDKPIEKQDSYLYDENNKDIPRKN